MVTMYYGMYRIKSTVGRQQVPVPTYSFQCDISQLRASVVSLHQDTGAVGTYLPVPTYRTLPYRTAVGDAITFVLGNGRLRSLSFLICRNGRVSPFIDISQQILIKVIVRYRYLPILIKSLHLFQTEMMDQFTADLKTAWLSLGLPLKTTNAGTVYKEEFQTPAFAFSCPGMYVEVGTVTAQWSRYQRELRFNSPL